VYGTFLEPSMIWILCHSQDLDVVEMKAHMYP
jgi:hypothetical protein